MEPGFPYIYCCSNRKGHKNEFRLLQAFKLTHFVNDLKLVFSGEPKEKADKKLNSMGLGGKVLYTGKISDEMMASWYRGAVATVFPSLYEGFGLPVIESMACGTPVIASNTTSLPEAGGDAAYYVDPMEPESIAEGIRRILHDEALLREMREKGLKRASLFTWDRTAKLVEDALIGMVDS